MYHRLNVSFTIAALSAAAMAQGPDVRKITSQDWKERNAAALALAASSETFAQDLLKVLATEWDDGITDDLLWNSAVGVGAPGKEPRAATLANARELVANLYSRYRRERLTSKEQLVAPWHAHQLAEWVLRREGKGPIPNLEPTDRRLARIWLVRNQPDQAALRSALTTEATANAVATAIWEMAEEFPKSLLDYLTIGSEVASQAVLELLPINHDQLEAKHIAALIEYFMTGEEQRSRQRAGKHLVNLGTRAAEQLVPFLAKNDEPCQMALALLCLMGPHAAPATDALLGCLQHNRIHQRRALVALADIPLSAEQRATVARAVFALLRSTRVRAIRTLAFDALANCGDGVDESMITELQTMFGDRKYRSSRPRMLGCMRRLGCMPEISTQLVTRIVNGAYPNTQSWLALADRGTEGREALQDCIGKYKPGVDDDEIGRVLVATAPGMLVEWLANDSRSVRSLALHTLQAQRPELLEFSTLASLVPDTSIGGEAFDALCLRKDAKRRLPKVLATLKDASFYVRAEHIEHLHSLQPSLPMLLEALSTHLKAGRYWLLVRGIDDDTLKKHVRQWVDQCQEEENKAMLIGHLVRLGLNQAIDIQLVAQALQGEHRAAVASVLSRHDSVPSELTTVLESICSNPANRDEYNSARRALLAISR